MPRQALAKHDLARVIHPHRMEHALGDIDPEDVHLLLHGTRLLWLYGFSALAPIVTHESRSAQGRVHFINARVLTQSGAGLGGYSPMPLPSATAQGIDRQR